MHDSNPNVVNDSNPNVVSPLETATSVPPLETVVRALRLRHGLVALYSNIEARNFIRKGVE
jgi:hypothetical protein